MMSRERLQSYEGGEFPTTNDHSEFRVTGYSFLRHDPSVSVANLLARCTCA